MILEVTQNGLVYDEFAFKKEHYGEVGVNSYKRHIFD